MGYLKCLDVMYELGRINEAELIGHEVWELVGRHARVTRMLALLNVAKDRPEVARAFLNSMTSDPVWGRWAKRTLDRLRADPRLSENPEVNRLRHCRITEDCNQYMPVEDMLAQSLDNTPDNRMAYEYLMGHLLLQRQLGKFMVYADRMGDVGYPRIPLHYEEALALYGALAMKDVAVPGHQISAETRERTDEFLAVIASRGGPTEGARKALAESYAGSYLYYYFFPGQGIPQ
jgi:hypothetical protein